MLNNPGLLGRLTPAEFLKKYWQKKPLLIRQAVPNFQSPVTPDDLAGIACQELANVRLVQQSSGKNGWTVEDGPFQESRFAGLPESNWTILVQEMEKWVPQIERLRQKFNFIPDWRTDDVMVSYAADQGSVGPHVDNYDVFLLQGMGQRRWQIGATRLDKENFIPDIELRILQKFRPDHEWILNPGDMLYLPPKIPHYGVAIGPCMTYSFGFRSPSANELLSALLESSGDDLDQIFYSDPDLKLQKNSGEIASDAVKKAIDLLRSLPVEPDEAVHWFGRLITQNRRHEPLDPPKRKLSSYAGMLTKKSNAQGLHKNPEVRFAYSKSKRNSVELFIDGNEIILSTAMTPIVKKLCGGVVFTTSYLSMIDPDSAEAKLILSLCNQGYLVSAD
jgi:50S ribosomal protein L16 3-hydroxylase